ncbi:alpha/beta fold hydrolase [Gordonibacter massiliensis (ex Traore et al. 2017)]|uniref:Putative 2-succinyl-6-hydroxy-2,4-cyclohexadiene-1-carboxylate synthase n=1 Tax=Gordonibacter massiliensis (ex Traore et al. 2017) TaxID=1841863 RepID=A0A842JFT1_9ACTN|nr:alpha/beta fold hydrolase [Gordonibacter massiliensis (ex Traore et al. 2017)]
MMTNRERFFRHGDVRYRYLVWEGDAAEVAPVVLLHGFAQSADSWDDVAKLLRRRRPVVALDLVGHGGSDRPQDARLFRLDRAADALVAFLEHVAGERAVPSVPVAGYSMGGRVALAAAIEDPRLFAALVLESTGLGPASSEERAAARTRDVANAARLREQGVEAFMDAWERLPLFATQRELPPDVRERLRAGRLANDAEALARSFEEAGQHAMPGRDAVLDCLRSLRDAEVPVLYLAGALDEKYCALAEHLRESNVCATRIVEGAGHNVHLEAPEAYVRVLEDFFACV